MVCIIENVRVKIICLLLLTEDRVHCFVARVLSVVNVEICSRIPMEIRCDTMKLQLHSSSLELIALKIGGRERGWS